MCYKLSIATITHHKLINAFSKQPICRTRRSLSLFPSRAIHFILDCNLCRLKYATNIKRAREKKRLYYFPALLYTHLGTYCSFVCWCVLFLCVLAHLNESNEFRAVAIVWEWDVRFCLVCMSKSLCCVSQWCVYATKALCGLRYKRRGGARFILLSHRSCVHIFHIQNGSSLCFSTFMFFDIFYTSHTNRMAIFRFFENPFRNDLNHWINCHNNIEIIKRSMNRKNLLTNHRLKTYLQICFQLKWRICHSMVFLPICTTI